jgi:hypothetical protein
MDEEIVIMGEKEGKRGEEMQDFDGGGEEGSGGGAADEKKEQVPISKYPLQKEGTVAYFEISFGKGRNGCLFDGTVIPKELFEAVPSNNSFVMPTKSRSTPFHRTIL